MIEPYYQTDLGKLYCGDAVDIMRRLPEALVDLTVTSPPYDNLRTYNGSLEWNEDIWKAIIKELFRVTKQGGVVVWVVGDATINGSETGTSFRQALWAKECGFNLHDTMIYQVPGAGAKGSNYSYWQVFEYMFILSKGKIKTVNRIKDKRNKKYGTKRTTNKQGRDGVKTRLHPPGGTIVQEFGYRDNVWVIPSGNGHSEYTGHPAPFPEKLAHDHIISWSSPDEGDMVFDPMVGSGTVPKMCEKLDRKWIACDMSQEYCDIAKDRIEKEAQQLKLFRHRGE